jgi:hypothetical protein
MIQYDNSGQRVCLDAVQANSEKRKEPYSLVRLLSIGTDNAAMRQAELLLHTNFCINTSW